MNTQTIYPDYPLSLSLSLSLSAPVNHYDGSITLLLDHLFVMKLTGVCCTILGWMNTRANSYATHIVKRLKIHMHGARQLWLHIGPDMTGILHLMRKWNGWMHGLPSCRQNFKLFSFLELLNNAMFSHNSALGRPRCSALTSHHWWTKQPQMCYVVRENDWLADQSRLERSM